ncbi:MAG: PorT family protein [Bacteroidetes bacterium]|nr:MAG: PorT family protein [Bacteroidota bacterium]
MKNLLFLLAVCFSFTGNIQAQVFLNVSGGANYSNYNVKNNYGVDFNPRFGYFINLDPGYQISEKLKLHLGIQYSERGYKSTFDTPPHNTSSTETKFKYLDFLPELDYYVYSPLSIGLGFYYGIKLSEQFRSGNDPWATTTLDLSKSTDLGLSTKIQFDFEPALLFIRYTKGLVDVTEINFTDENGVPVENAKQKSSCIQFGIGVKLFRDYN